MKKKIATATMAILFTGCAALTPVAYRTTTTTTTETIPNGTVTARGMVSDVVKTVTTSVQEPVLNPNQRTEYSDYVAAVTAYNQALVDGAGGTRVELDESGRVKAFDSKMNVVNLRPPEKNATWKEEIMSTVRDIAPGGWIFGTAYSLVNSLSRPSTNIETKGDVQYVNSNVGDKSAWSFDNSYKYTQKEVVFEPEVLEFDAETTPDPTPEPVMAYPK